MEEPIRFKGNYPPDSKWRYLSNLADREFSAQLPGLVPTRSRFGSVEALYQGLKFTATSEFAEGGLLNGKIGIETMVACDKPKYRNVWERYKDTGFTGGHIAMAISREKYAPSVHARTAGLLERLREHSPRLAGFMRRRESYNDYDRGLMLLGCQLLMFSQNAGARWLLLQTGEAPLEEHAELGTSADFWSVTPDGTSGQNANGKNLVVVRRLLRECGGPWPSVFFLGGRRLEAFAVALLDSLRPAITGDEGSAWSAEGCGTYSEVLDAVVAAMW